jgi:hypothetical protein
MQFAHLKSAATIEYELPSVSLSIGDILGRAARIWRANWKLFAGLYLFPEFLYVFCWELLVIAIENLWAPAGSTALRAAIIMVGMLSITTAVFLIRAACYAQWLLMSGREPTLSAALKVAYRFKLIVIYWPTIMVDLLEIAFATALVLMSQEVLAQQVQKTEELLGVSGLYIAFIIAWYMPFRMVKIANIFAAYHFLISESTYRKGLADMIVIFSRKPLQVMFSIFLLSLVLGLIEMPVYLFTVLETILSSTTKISHEQLKWIETIPRAFAESCIGAIGSAIAANATLLLDNEWRIRVEGRDVIENLKRLDRAF